jgi:hypothetical protein
MPTCPVCRSQNMETAKFCGNCGNPFPRTSETTSSLLKCEHGHIYSAVYANCPYCPQPEAASSGAFETRIEESVVFIEPPPPTAPPTGDFATRIEAPAFSSSDLATRIETPIPNEFINREEKPQAPTDDLNKRAAAKPPSTVSVPMPGTELLNEGPSFETTITEEPLNVPVVQSVPLPPPVSSVRENPPAAPPPPQVAQAVQPPPPPSAASAGGRHTSVMSLDDAQRALGSKGKLVGWLVSYTRNPDGEDFKLRAGYNRMGANPACDIVVEDETVSGSHAIIVFREGRCLIKDDLSRNGTFVNGKEITEAHPLQNYDQIRVGNTTLTFVAAQNA